MVTIVMTVNGTKRPMGEKHSSVTAALAWLCFTSAHTDAEIGVCRNGTLNVDLVFDHEKEAEHGQA